MDKRYDHKVNEQRLKELWQQEAMYQQHKHPGPLYNIDTPPPTVSGSLHIGHIFSYTQTDILARYQRMNGASVFYPFGFDDNGLPTERYVEKKHGVSPFTMGRSPFIALCLQETQLMQEQFKNLWQRMGLSADFDHSYSTISDHVRKVSQESFLRLLERGCAYRKFEPALYCTTCQTSVAQAELDDLEKASTFNTIAFKAEDGTPLLIATTRPELLGSCVAVFYNPTDERYAHLKNKHVIVPLYDLRVPLMPDELVDKGKGTGLVMCCAFGDKTDIAWIKKYNLTYKQIIDTRGRLTEHAQQLAGLKVNEARAKILELLQNAGVLREQKSITHAVNVHERCKKEIEYLAISQWFLNILDHKQHLIALAEQINWYPAFMKSRYINWVENISWDWCLSRQRFFGIPFPVWHCTDCKAILVPRLQDLPIDPQETAYPGGVCIKCSGSSIVPDTDVMDTWNTSSLTPYICYNLYQPTNSSVFGDHIIGQFLPMAMRPQAHDIIRTWAFYTLVKVYLHNQTIAWKDIVISGHVLSDNNEKLSKSKEQKKLDPATLIDEYSADVIRYWTASASLGNDVSFNQTQLKLGQRLVTKLWNAFLFIKEHTSTITGEKEYSKQSNIVNQWLLHQVSSCFKTYQYYLNGHEFNLALDSVEKFFWHDFCDNYLELIKDQLFNPSLYDAQQVQATQWTLYHVGLRIIQMYAPYLPFITDAIFQNVYKEKEGVSSLHMSKFISVQMPYDCADSIEKMAIINTLVQQVRKLKTEHQLSLKADIALLIVYTNNESNITTIQQLEQLVKGVTRALRVEYVVENRDCLQLEQQAEGIIVKLGV